MKTKDKDETALVSLVISLALVLPFAAWYGFVIKTVWSWFVVPLGVVSIGVWEAAGLYLLIRTLTMDTTLNRDDDKTAAERLAGQVGVGILVPAMVLGFAAIYHAFA